MKRRPTGLTVFAIINFVFAGITMLSFLVAILSPLLRDQAGLPLSLYTILSPLGTVTLLVISGVGFLKMSYRGGFVCGIAFCVLSLANIIVFNALQGFQGFLLHVPSMIYPTLLLLMLTLRYKQAFHSDEITTEPDAPANARGGHR